MEQAYERILTQMPDMMEQMGISEGRQPMLDRYTEEALVVLKEVVSLKKMMRDLKFRFEEIEIETLSLVNL